MLQQFSKPLEALKLEFGADSFRLVAKNLEPITPRQQILGGELQVSQGDFDQLISTLGNRLGFDRVRRFIPQNYHLPELAYSSVEVVSKIEESWNESTKVRPFRLLKYPERLRTLEAGRPPLKFEWRRKAFSSLRTSGPERLAPPWWQAKDNRLRDYWTIQTEQGPRLWLMTYPASECPDWYVAGQFV